jgi:hypothetical protein
MEMLAAIRGLAEIATFVDLTLKAALMANVDIEGVHNCIISYNKRSFSRTNTPNLAFKKILRCDLLHFCV